jgi:hypothetical protein
MLAEVMLQYLAAKVVMSIVEFMMWRVGKGVNLRSLMRETSPFTEKAMILKEQIRLRLAS